jgi:hypothetical protein
MTSLSISELFKIDNKYFKTNWTDLEPKFGQVNLSTIPQVKETSVAIGIEVEMEYWKNIGSGLHEHLWGFKGDGSLRNNGMEAISVPVKGEWIRYALKTLFEVISKVKFTPRTSIHIHLDVRQLNQKQLTAFILVYLSVESLLYKFVGKERDDSIYCVPLYTTTLVNSLVDLLNKSIVRNDYSNSRYAGLNLDSLRKFGTLEFRQLHGTHDTTKIMNWINLIFKIYQFSLHSDFNALLKKITELNTNSFYIAYVNEVFEDMVGVLDLLDIKSDLEKGVKAVKQSIISNKFASELRLEIAKQSPAGQRYVLLNKGPYVAQYFSERNA